MNVISPDISVLDFTVLYDLSGATPAITITNASTGSNLAGCHWWYEILTPSGTYIHKGIAGSPDVNGTWTTINVTSGNAWPQPFGQIEWSSIPFTATLYVKDSANTIFSLPKATVIIRPIGSVTANKNNFGTSKQYLEVKCDNGKIYAEDRTAYSWNGIAGVNTARTWTLVYPPDETDTVPSPFVLADASNGLFPINFSAPGYQMILTSTMRYDYANGTSVKIKYKSRDAFTVACDIDLCPLLCDFAQLLETASSADCSNKADLDDKIRKINGLLTMALIGKTQPLCGVDVGKLVEEIKEIGGFTCNCSLTGAGVNGSSNSNSALAVSIISDGGDIAGSASVTGSNVVIHLHDKSYVFEICSDSDLQDAFSIQSTTVNNVKTYCLKVNSAALVTAVATAVTAATACCPIYVPVHMLGTTNAPAGCPNSYFPARVYSYNGGAIIGIAQSISDLVSILNGNATWNVKGTAFVAGNCKVGFTPATGITSIAHVQVDLQTTGGGGNGTPPCVGNTTSYVNNITDRCTGAVVPVLQFPADYFVQYTTGGPIYNIGQCVDYNEIISKLTAETHRPTTITFTNISGNRNGDPRIIGVEIFDANCAANDEVTIFMDYVAEIFIGANYNSAAGTHNGVNELDVNQHLDLGKVCSGINATARVWQIIQMDNGSFIYACDTSSGKLYKINVALPLHPWVANTVTLPASPGAGSPPNAPFSGAPTIGGVASHYDVFFPSEDFSGTVLYILESTAGVIYKYDMATDTVLGSFYSVKLVGKCPRLVWNDILYFTHDGSRETDAGLNSTIARTDILLLDLTNFAAGGLSTVTIGIAEDEPWAMSRDKATGIAWISTKQGSARQFDLSTNTPGTWAFGLWNVSGGSFVKRVNTVISQGYMYASCYGKGTKYVNLNALSGSFAFEPLNTPTANLLHHNFTPVPGKCYGVLAFEKNGTTGGLARYSLDGKFLALNNLRDGSTYNGIALIPDDTDTSNNSLC